MKKNTKIILTLSIFMVSFGIVIGTIGFLSGGFNAITMIGRGMWNFNFIGSHMNYVHDYSEGNTYEVNATDIDTLKINWIAGDVSVIPYDGSTIKLAESADSEITKENGLRYAINHNTLQIDYVETGFLDFPFNQLDGKKLVIKVPRKLTKEMTAFDFNSTSANLEIHGIRLNSFKADTTSGNTVASDLEINKDFTINSTSGDFSAHQITANNLVIETTSGNVKGENIVAHEVEMDSASGDLLAHFLACPDRLNLDSISGDTKISLPKNSNATIALDSLSGKLSSDFPIKLQDEEYLIGTGHAKFDLSTTSGDVEVNMN